jgi:hypothetical protein
MRYRFFTALIALAMQAALPNSLPADDYYQTWRWGHLGVDHGLSSETILNVVESSDSVLWVETLDGVSWFE